MYSYSPVTRGGGITKLPKLPPKTPTPSQALVLPQHLPIPPDINHRDGPTTGNVAVQVLLGAAVGGDVGFHPIGPGLCQKGSDPAEAQGRGPIEMSRAVYDPTGEVDHRVARHTSQTIDGILGDDHVLRLIEDKVIRGVDMGDQIG